MFSDLSHTTLAIAFAVWPMLLNFCWSMDGLGGLQAHAVEEEGETMAANEVDKQLQVSSIGARVLVLEKYLIPGESSGFYQKDGFTFDVGSSVMFGFSDKANQKMSKVVLLKDLYLEIDGMKQAKLQSNASPRKESYSTVRSSQAENRKTSMESFTKKPLRDGVFGSCKKLVCKIY